ncbi:hypothetical protein [Actinoplanes auranticolor]|uniref:hypothetical protein n=1 Tax=Actinoplanes auranticolor TaxID=47988 RepID=UPI001BB3162F|nr:hypothetical protein [Actinoplanes auranticolor]
MDPDIAELAASTGSRIFRTAYRKWLESNEGTDLTTVTESVMSQQSGPRAAPSASFGPHEM